MHQLPWWIDSALFFGIGMSIGMFMLSVAGAIRMRDHKTWTTPHKVLVSILAHALWAGVGFSFWIASRQTSALMCAVAFVLSMLVIIGTFRCYLEISIRSHWLNKDFDKGRHQKHTEHTRNDRQ